jgi:hypothetical protein
MLKTDEDWYNNHLDSSSSEDSNSDSGMDLSSDSDDKSPSSSMGLVRDFKGRRLFLALAIADSFALARRACNNSFAAMGVSDVANPMCNLPWLGLHRISHSDAMPFMPDENNERKQLTGKRLVFHRNTKTNTKTTTKTKTTRKRYCERG